jgi:hypothetical protein
MVGDILSLAGYTGICSGSSRDPDGDSSTIYKPFFERMDL